LIEINLLEQKKPFKLPTILGVDISTLNFKMIFIALLLLKVPDWFLIEQWAAERKEIEGQVASLRIRYKKIKKELNKNKGKKELLKVFNTQIKKLQRRTLQVDKIIKSRTNPRRVLEKMARIVPEDVWFTSLVISEKDEFSVDGLALSYKSIGNLITLTKESSYFGKNITLGETTTKMIPVGSKEVRVEKFKIKGVVENYNPRSN
jgi:Tfp pilus assembly protein PilN